MLLDELALHLWPIWMSASDLLCSEMQLLRVLHLIWDHHWEPSSLKVRERLKPVEEKRDYFLWSCLVGFSMNSFIKDGKLTLQNI